MMSPNSTIKEQEIKFQQRWEFRREYEFDSSSNDTKSSGDSVLKKQKLISELAYGDSDEISDGSKFQQVPNHDPGPSLQPKPMEPKKKKRRGQKGLSADDQMEKSCHIKVEKKRKITTGGYDPDAMDDLKIYMESLIDDIRVAGENLSTWMREEMQKLVRDGTASEARKDKVRLQKQGNPMMHDMGMNTQAHHDKSFNEFAKKQQENKLEDKFCMQHVTDFERDLKVNHEKSCKENIQQHSGRSFRSSKRAGDISALSLKTKKMRDPNDINLAFQGKVDYNQAIVPFKPTGKDGEDRLALFTNTNSDPSPSNRNVKMHQRKSIVLGIRAHNCNVGNSVKSTRGRKKADFNDCRQSHEDETNHGQDVGCITLAEKSKAERFEFSVDPDSLPQVASSMYLTRPTIMRNPSTNHELGASSFNTMQSTAVENHKLANPETSALIFGSSSYYGYYQGMSLPEESTSSGSTSQFNQNGAWASFIGNGFPVPLHHAASGGFSILGQLGLENLGRENISALGGPIRPSEGNNYLPEQYSANNFPSHSNYKANNRILPHQDCYQFP
ncbi:hypothetical protein K2173_022608 [Erythroxylum novogranatense]|uniref:Uncharacterized protein n=1 Tax=Erythroxylum novogranatense TaxID=1862640 RepID=A0AAV8TRR9_9ROSI|nr:hypothetical protein K2173_022608 [Erythroxylum novogranatense]